MVIGSWSRRRCNSADHTNTTAGSSSETVFGRQCISAGVGEARWWDGIYDTIRMITHQQTQPLPTMPLRFEIRPSVWLEVRLWTCDGCVVQWW